MLINKKRKKIVKELIELIFYYLKNRILLANVFIIKKYNIFLIIKL